MTQTEIKKLGRAKLSRAGYSDAHIGTILPTWISGFREGVKSEQPKQAPKK